MPARKKRKTRPKRKVGKTSRRKRKKSALKKIAKWHSLLTIAVLILYLALGFWLGPGALQKDFKGKVAGATTVLSLHIAGPPGKPVVTTSTGYENGWPYILLSWPSTSDTDSYGVYRNGVLLVSGLTHNPYQDMSVTPGTTYSYYVVANGPLGSTQSDTVSATAPSDVPPPPPPPENVVCRITTLDKIDLTNFRCLPITKKKRPVFSGTTNVSNARIQAEISTPSAKRKVISSFLANENGYWSWGVQGQLKKGTKIIYVKATDPNDSSRFGTCSLRFKVSNKGYSKKKMKKCTGAVAYQTLFVPPSYKFSKPLNLQFKNYEKPFFSGDNIEFETDFKDAFPVGTSEQKISFQLVDFKNNTIYQEEKNKLSDKEGKIAESLKIPLYVSSGQYKIIAQIMKGDEVVTAERDLAVEEKPFIQFSSNWRLTYAELFSNLGWAVVILTALLLAFFGLLAFEYHLSQYAVIQVTEKELKKEGYID